MRPLAMSVAIAVPLILLLTGCTAKRALTRTPRSAIEQLLLAGAARRAAARLDVPDLSGTTVFLEVAGLTQDAEFAGEIVASELQSRGAVVVPDAANATRIVKVVVLALGTDQTEAFVGIPAMSGVLLPIPEITLLRRRLQTGRSRLRVSAIDARTGRIVGESEEVEGETAFTSLTILPFLFEWSDLDQSVERRETASAPEG